MAQEQTPETRRKSQATGKVRETIPGLEGLGEPHISGGTAGTVFHPERGKDEALPRLPREVGAGPSHSGAKERPQHEGHSTQQAGERQVGETYQLAHSY